MLGGAQDRQNVAAALGRLRRIGNPAEFPQIRNLLPSPTGSVETWYSTSSITKLLFRGGRGGGDAEQAVRVDMDGAQPERQSRLGYFSKRLHSITRPSRKLPHGKKEWPHHRAALMGQSHVS